MPPEKDIALGSVGSVDLKQEGGIASADLVIGPAQVGKYIKVSGGLKVELDEVSLIKDLVAKYGPSGILGEILAAAEAALLPPAPPSA